MCSETHTGLHHIWLFSLWKRHHIHTQQLCVRSLTFFGEPGDVCSQVLDAPAPQIHRQLEECDSARAADGPGVRHRATHGEELLQQPRKHCSSSDESQTRRCTSMESWHMHRAPFSAWPGCLAFTLCVKHFLSVVKKLSASQRNGELLLVTQASQKSSTSLLLWTFGRTEQRFSASFPGTCPPHHARTKKKK